METFAAKLARNLEVDVLKLVDSRMGICANSGAGKSHALRLLIEHVAGRIPVHLIDHEGEYVTLRAPLDAVLVSADDGDIAPDPRTAYRLAQRLREAQVSAILDVSGLDDTVDRLQFVAKYIRGLLASPRKSWRPTLVTLDEGHRFAPEVVSRGGKRELVQAYHDCRSAVISLMDSGRKRQLGGVIATQRLSKVAKDALSEANNLLIGRFAQDTDLRRVSSLLGLDHDAWETIKAFEPGEFFAQGPALSKPGTTKIHTLKTKTRPPREGGNMAASRPSASARRLLAELERLHESEPPPKDVPKGKKAKAPALPAPVTGALERLQRQLDAQRSGFEQQLGSLRDEVVQLLELPVRELPGRLVALSGRFELSAPPPNSDSPPPRRTKRGPKAPLKLVPSSKSAPSPKPAPAPKAPSPPRGGNGRSLPFNWNTAPGHILTVLIQYHPERLEPRRVAALAGLNFGRSTWRNSLSKIRAANLIDENADGMTASAEAVEHHAWTVEPLPSGADRINQWKARLGAGVLRQLFEHLVESGEDHMDRTELSAAVGLTPKSSTFRNALAKLRNYGLVERSRGRGTYIELAAHVCEARS